MGARDIQDRAKNASLNAYLQLASLCPLSMELMCYCYGPACGPNVIGQGGVMPPHKGPASRLCACASIQGAMEGCLNECSIITRHQICRSLPFFPCSLIRPPQQPRSRTPCASLEGFWLVQIRATQAMLSPKHHFSLCLAVISLPGGTGRTSSRQPVL